MNAVNQIEAFKKFDTAVGLERMEKLLERLGNPEKDLKVIHVAGTNGKGSITKYIYSILLEAGYSVGLYTSPYLEVFNERIEADGEMISDDDLERLSNRVIFEEKRLEEEGVILTQFEVITAIAFLYYKEKNVDFVVLEVGLGGRKDATNVIKKPLVSVIASISFDHTDRLGNTIPEIAYEKAGIIKDGCPVVTSCKDEEALSVIERVAGEHKAMFFETRNIPCTIKKESLREYVFDATIQGIEYEDITISMAGKHQVENAICALSTVDILEEMGDISITRKNIYDGLKKAKVTGRFEIMSLKPLVIIDGAHNPDGTKRLEEAITDLLGDKKIQIVNGMLKDKDTKGALSNLVKLTKDFIVTEPDSPRKMSAEELASELKDLGAEPIVVSKPEDAVSLAKSRASNFDATLYTGSLYLIGQLRHLLH